jgi:hypothetical protein
MGMDRRRHCAVASNADAIEMRASQRTKMLGIFARDLADTRDADAIITTRDAQRDGASCQLQKNALHREGRGPSGSYTRAAIMDSPERSSDVVSSSPVKNCARPLPNDQSSSVVVTIETTASSGPLSPSAGSINFCLMTTIFRRSLSRPFSKARAELCRRQFWSRRAFAARLRSKAARCWPSQCHRRALMLTELVTNAAKHAFPNKNGALIRTDVANREGC